MSAAKSLSGAQCVAALVRAGFEARHRSAGVTILERGYRVLVVPDTPAMSRDQVATILSAAGVTYARFLELLDAPSDPRLRSGVRVRFDR